MLGVGCWVSGVGAEQAAAIVQFLEYDHSHLSPQLKNDVGEQLASQVASKAASQENAVAPCVFGAGDPKFDAKHSNMTSFVFPVVQNAKRQKIMRLLPTEVGPATATRARIPQQTTKTHRLPSFQWSRTPKDKK